MNKEFWITNDVLRVSSAAADQELFAMTFEDVGVVVSVEVHIRWTRLSLHEADRESWVGKGWCNPPVLVNPCFWPSLDNALWHMYALEMNSHRFMGKLVIQSSLSLYVGFSVQKQGRKKGGNLVKNMHGADIIFMHNRNQKHKSDARLGGYLKRWPADRILALNNHDGGMI